ncbi:hypothetical protein H6G91_35340 [Nostoc muscorum FACHB-395]|nr:hypothetical protein [Desmonostoc muscorum FACHB-395]
MKTHKNWVALSRIFGLYLGLHLEVQDMSQPINQTKRVAIESQRRHQEYRVQYHRHNEKRWINAGTFRTRADAQRDLRNLEHKCYQARIVNL